MENLLSTGPTPCSFYGGTLLYNMVLEIFGTPNIQALYQALKLVKTLMPITICFNLIYLCRGLKYKLIFEYSALIVQFS